MMGMNDQKPDKKQMRIEMQFIFCDLTFMIVIKAYKQGRQK